MRLCTVCMRVTWVMMHEMVVSGAGDDADNGRE
jgi:hypothetical protein